MRNGSEGAPAEKSHGIRARRNGIFEVGDRRVRRSGLVEVAMMAVGAVLAVVAIYGRFT